MVDLRRAIIILMALACVVTVIGVIHCHVNNPDMAYWYGYRMGYTIVFPILLSLSGFLLIEQLLITDGTLAPLNRLRIIYAFAAAIALFTFGVSAAVVAGRRWQDHGIHHGAIIAAVISFVGVVVYITEAVLRNRKSRIV